MKKKLFIVSILYFVFYSLTICDTKQDEHVHQYIVREAYKLLKYQLGFDIPVMRYKVGNTEEGTGPFSPGGLLVIGAHREDQEDIVFGHGNYFTHSCTHFWDSDCGDTEKWNYDLGSLYENAYEKAIKYFNGQYGFTIDEDVYSYSNGLWDFYSTGNIYFIGTWIDDDNINYVNVWVFKDQNFKNRIVWEILGRIAHLLADMGVPAHTHHDAHPAPLGDADAYEIAMASDYIKNDYRSCYNAGGFINVTGNSNPLKYLFYTTNQITQVFPSKDGGGNNTCGINEPFSNYPPLQTIISTMTANMGGVPTTVNVDSIRKYAYVYSIRATAGLLYWAANEMNLFTGVKKVPENYSTLQAAVSSAVSGDVIVVNSGTHYISSPLTIPTGVQVAINNGATLNINSSLIINGELNIVPGGSKNINISGGSITVNGTANWNDALFSLTNSTITINSALEWNRSSSTLSNSNLVINGVFYPNSTTLNFGLSSGFTMNGTMLSNNSIFNFGNSSSFILAGSITGSCNTIFQGNGIMGSWNGIVTNSTSAALYQTIIRDAIIGISVNSTISAFSTNDIRNCSTGVVFNNCFNYSFQGNKILFNNIGLKYSGNSWGLYFPNNVIVDNDNNIYIESGSHPDFGMMPDQGRNNIYNAGPYDVISYYPGTITARYNWWGAYQSIPCYVGMLDYFGSLDNDPNPSMNSNSGKEIIAQLLTKKISDNGYDVDPGIKMFDEAMRLYLQKKKDESIKLLYEVLKSHPDKLSGRLSLITIDQCLKEEKRENERTNLYESVITGYSDKNLIALSKHLRAKGMMDLKNSRDAVIELEEILKINPEFENMPFVLYDLGAQYYFALGDKLTGEKYLEELINKFPNKDITLSAVSILCGEYKYDKEIAKKGNNSNNSDIKLFANYPNPFNPSTTIRYSIPQDLHVKLKVYDITGKEVAVLVNEMKQAGEYNVEFNAAKYASGIYYYKLEAGSYKNIQKMVLVK